VSPLPQPSRLVLCLFGLLLIFATKDRPDSWADASRLGTIQALVEEGTLALDETRYFWQGDRVWLGDESFTRGAYYSHQPPMLALIGALPYAGLHHLGGRAIDDPWTYRLLTLSLVGLPVLLGLWALAHLLRGSGCSAGWGATWLALAAVASLLLPYSLVLNQHGPAFGLFSLALLAAARRRCASAGVLLGLATTIDLTAVFPAIAVCIPVLASGGLHGLVRYAVAASPPIALHLGVNHSLVGDLLPLGLHAEAFRYPLSPFLVMSLTGSGAEELAGTQAAYAWRALFGGSGLFSLQPLMLLCAGCGVALLSRRFRTESAGQRGVVPAVILATLGIGLYYITQSRNFGGTAFGMRWFCVFAPLLVLLPATLFGPRPPRWIAPLVLLLGTWSAGATLVGAAQPWAKFAWLPTQRPMAMLEDQAQDAPGQIEHLRREWSRIRDLRESFTREGYELWYEDLLHRHGRVRLSLSRNMEPSAARDWVEEGIETLQPLVDLLDRANHPASARPVGHYWLGRFHERLGASAAADRELRACLALAPEYTPAQKALEGLER